MHNSQAYTIIDNIRAKWVRHQVYSSLLLSAAVALPFIFTATWQAPVLVLGLSMLTFLYARSPWKLQQEEVARYLNQTFPDMEDSAALLLKSPETLSMLEKLQTEKITPVLHSLQLPRTFYRPLRQAATVLGGSVLLCAIWGIFLTSVIVPSNQQITLPVTGNETATIPPGISKVKVSIHPPAYTGKAVRTQAGLNIIAEDSAIIRWELHTSGDVKELALWFNDSTRLLPAPDKDSTTWTATRTIRKSGFYEVRVNKVRSQLYQLQMKPDQPPVIRMLSPEPYTTIDFGASAKVNVRAALTDDYGIRQAQMHLTIASGNGESVRFKEQQLSFDNNFSAHAPAYQLARLLNLTTLGLKPGDELYFYITTTDTRWQQSRSDVYIVTLPDTARLFSMDGLVNGVNFKPEYFRSQRQIILDAEQLLKDRDSLGKEKFNQRSNELGTDQKLLRLRYGKFLGEENESNIGDARVAAEEGHDHDHGHDHEEAAADPKDFGNAARILDEFTDKHDNAEDATFLDPAVKQQLRATLTEMWKSELQLRMYKPQDALPFAYKALRLLKDLQQQSRVYVAKTGVKTTPLKPEKRLTGELDKILPAIKKETLRKTDPQSAVRIALSVIDGLRAGEKSGDPAILQQATQLLAARAAASPAAFLSALEAMQRIQRNQFTGRDLRQAQQGLQQMLDTPSLLPQQTNGAAAENLPQRYFKNLKTGSKP
ncbi:DUF4175 domain-containing protein [Chitinophaga solisilvae]|uniref:DUF4175 domain-containing protein n=1 Tax=Chitinophaga solisilvae TaxID=1233460 RepID=UPI00136E06F4|nr:DUF4175 domain-containing protein [Chitinophaga solisilvae]